LLNEYTLFFNDDLILEIRNTMNKLKFKKYFGKNSFGEMLNAFEDYIELVDGFTKLSLCRDEKDDFLLNLPLMEMQII